MKVNILCSIIYIYGYVSILNTSLQVLWFNWRDIRNPDAGGAEVLTQEIACRLVKNYNYDITIFSAQFHGGLPAECIDGVNIIREGGKYSVYNKARNYYKKHKDSYDIVIDEINVKPFLTPKFVKEKPILTLIHQMSTELFSSELSFPLNYIGRYYLENKWLSYYKELPIVTVSNSTKEDLEKRGFKNISVIPVGLSTTALSVMPQKESIPTLIFIARLVKHKLPHHAIEAFSQIKKKIPSLRLWIIGDGYMRSRLEKANVKDVTFYGHVGSELKNKLLSKAQLVLVPATREGWGLVVIESNAMGTPVVAYDVPGLRDSVMHGQNGILTREKTSASLGISAISLLNDPKTLDELSSHALAYSKQFSWDISASAFDKIIKNLVEKKVDLPPIHALVPVRS